MKEDRFSFEDLEVWQEVVDFADKCLNLIEKIETDRKHYRLIEQFESAATSPALNIAEGKGRYSKKEEFTIIKMDAIQLGKRISSLINSIKKSCS